MNCVAFQSELIVELLGLVCLLSAAVALLINPVLGLLARIFEPLLDWFDDRYFSELQYRMALRDGAIRFARAKLMDADKGVTK